MAYTTLSGGSSVISESQTELPNGQTIVTEIIQQGEDQFITASILVDAKGQKLTSTYCGTCSGVSVGCVTCNNNDPVLDCINRRIYCAS